ncbi:hypothetical protein CN611_32255, partial [Bacillus wiedmannii]
MTSQKGMAAAGELIRYRFKASREYVLIIVASLLCGRPRKYVPGETAGVSDVQREPEPCTPHANPLTQAQRGRDGVQS